VTSANTNTSCLSHHSACQLAEHLTRTLITVRRLEGSPLCRNYCISCEFLAWRHPFVPPSFLPNPSRYLYLISCSAAGIPAAPNERRDGQANRLYEDHPLTEQYPTAACPGHAALARRGHFHQPSGHRSQAHRCAARCRC